MGQNFITEEEADRLRHDPEAIESELEEYRQKSISTTAEELQEDMEDCEDLLLVAGRQFLEDAALTPEQRIILAESDKRIADKMKPETLQDYLDEYPRKPIRDWWGK